MLTLPRKSSMFITRFRRVVEDALMFSSPTEITLNGNPIENSLRIIEGLPGRLLGMSEYVLQDNTVTLMEEVSRAKTQSTLHRRNIPKRAFSGEIRRCLQRHHQRRCDFFWEAIKKG